MKIKFLKDIELEIVLNFYEAEDSLETITETLFKDEIVSTDVIADYEDSVDCQFSRGSVVLSLAKESFEVVER
jgi:hypothetical protein